MGIYNLYTHFLLQLYSGSGGKDKGTYMGKLDRFERVGLRDKETKALIAVYPKRPEGPDDKIEEDVKYWYYQQSCSAEEELKGLFVDHLTEHELKSIQGK